MAQCENCVFKPGLVDEVTVCAICKGSGTVAEPVAPKAEEAKKRKK